MRKAQTQLIGYLITILLGIILLVSTIAIVVYFYEVSLRDEIRKELRELTLQTFDSILKLYEIGKNSNVNPNNYSSILIAESYLILPSSVSNRNYEIILVSPGLHWQTFSNFSVNGKNTSFVEETQVAKIIARTTQDPLEIVEKELPNINIELQGKCENGKEAKLRYYRYNINGSVYDKITLGKAEILINIENISW